MKKCHPSRRSGTGGLTAGLNRTVFAVSPQLIRGNSSLGFRVLTGWFGVMWCPVHEHAIPLAAGRTLRSVLMGTTGARITFPAEAGSENWRVPATRPLFPPGPTWSQTQTMCVLTLWTSTYCLPGCLVGKCSSLFNNIWSQETFSPSLLPLLFESPLFVSLLGSVGESGKWFLSLSGLHRHTPPSWSLRSKLGTR